ncbi:NEDD8-specific protease 1 [Rhynchospora pubera]|uniref:NEDD8-specific protease 1 n=1 Tax=Rhynchospora pubera TaxID=906938 RepID=A0AAV8GVE9_9POAL|nr:NEDD8-specific protease 1 [Rhynchospora pubera]
MASGRGRGRGEDDDRIVSYGDATLVRSDLAILRGPYYLNDRLIHFFFTHLELGCDEGDNILLVPPSLAFLIAHFPGPSSSLADVVAPLALSRRKLVLFPVNDNPDVTLAEGGSHWSLLVCHVPSRLFAHHDSSGRLNSPHARHLFHSLNPFFISPQDFRYIEGPTPMQTNGYDCGLYVMAIARCVCQWYYQGKNKAPDDDKENWFAVLSDQLYANKVHELRGELLSLVFSLMTETESKNTT